MKKRILILAGLVVISGTAFFMFLNNESEVSIALKQPQGGQKSESEEASEPPMSSIDNSFGLENFPKETALVQNLILKSVKLTAERTKKLARKICSKDAAEALEKATRCSMKILESEGFSMAQISELVECTKKYGADKQDVKDCQQNVNIETAKQYCTPKEVEIFSSYTECISNNSSILKKGNMDMNAAREISQKCMSDNPIATLSSECTMGMAGMS